MGSRVWTQIRGSNHTGKLSQNGRQSIGEVRLVFASANRLQSRLLIILHHFESVLAFSKIGNSGVNGPNLELHATTLHSPGGHYGRSNRSHSGCRQGWRVYRHRDMGWWERRRERDCSADQMTSSQCVFLLLDISGILSLEKFSPLRGDFWSCRVTKISWIITLFVQQSAPQAENFSKLYIKSKHFLVFSLYMEFSRIFRPTWNFWIYVEFLSIKNPMHISGNSTYISGKKHTASSPQSELDLH